MAKINFNKILETVGEIAGAAGDIVGVAETVGDVVGLAGGNPFEVFDNATGAVLEALGVIDEGGHVLADVPKSTPPPVNFQLPQAAPQDHGVYVHQGPTLEDGEVSHTIGSQKLVIPPLLTETTKEWVRKQISARGMSEALVNDPWFLVVAAVSQGVIPPPVQESVPRTALDWMSSSQFEEGSKLGSSRHDSSIDRIAKWALRVRLGERIGYIYLDRYQPRPKRRRYTRTTKRSAYAKTKSRGRK